MPIIWIIRFASVVAICLAIYGSYSFVENKGYNRAMAEIEAIENAKLKEHIEKLKQAGEQHEKDQATINRLAGESSRVRVKFPVCKSSSEENTDGGSGLLSERMEQGFAELQGKAGELMLRCDQLNIDAIEANKAR